MRIRYNEMVDESTGSPNGLMRSARNYQHPTNGAQYFVVLNPSTFEFKIFDAVAGMDAGIVFEGKGSSSHKMKLLAKNTLIRLGVGFPEERRKPRTNENLDPFDPS